jgi:hypothetical protein
VQSDQQFYRDLAQFLSPVQRARLFIMMRRFEERIDDIRGQLRDRRPGMAPMGPGQQGPGPGPMPRQRRPGEPELDDFEP